MIIPVPPLKALDHILPRPPILLMGAGPTPPTPEVERASATVFSHLGATMQEIIKQLQSMAQYVFQTRSPYIFGIAGPASAAMEMSMTSLVWPGRKVLVLNLGTFSARFAEIARGLGGEVTELIPAALDCFHVDQVKAELEKKSYDVLTIVHGETSCGIMNTECEQICKLAKSYGLMVAVDAVVTVSCLPIPMDEWQIDFMFTGGQKGLSAIPGVSLIALSPAAFEFVSKRTEAMPHWCLDVRRAWKFWGKGEYHYTAPVTGVLALYESLRLICEETLEKRFERHTQSTKLLQHGLHQLGLTLYAPESCHLPSVIAVRTPEGLDAKKLIAFMIEQHRVEMSGAFGLPIFRIGQMGEQAREHNVRRTLQALEQSLNHFKA